MKLDLSVHVDRRQKHFGELGICQMTDRDQTHSDQTHPLGDEETDQINPAVAEELTPEQIDFLCRQSTVVGRKKLQVLRQALFEWVSEHLEYRFTEALFADTVRHALEEFMYRHSAEAPVSEPDRGSAVARSHETGG
jgi:hypothetical protein